MKTKVLTALLGLSISVAICAADGINYDGHLLSLNEEFSRTQCGVMAKATMPEVCGLACSRTTPGYITSRSSLVRTEW